MTGSPPRRPRSSGRRTSPSPSLRLFFLALEVERGRVDAVAQARGLRSVREDVAEVAAAGGTVHLGAGPEQAPVPLGLDGVRSGRLVEAGPAGPGVVLRLG